VVTIVSTEALTTNEHWLPMVPGEALLLRCGELVAHHDPQCRISAAV